jgi:hypothetical protein
MWKRGDLMPWWLSDSVNKVGDQDELFVVPSNLATFSAQPCDPASHLKIISNKG